MIELKQQLVESVSKRLNVGVATICKITNVVCVCVCVCVCACVRACVRVCVLMSSLQISNFAAEALLMSYGMKLLYV